MQTPKLAIVCGRTGITQKMAEEVFKAVSAQIPPIGPWAIKTGKYVIGQGENRNYMTVFALPFEGHADDWQVIQPIYSAHDLLRQLKGA